MNRMNPLSWLVLMAGAAACGSVRQAPPPVTPSAPELPVQTVRVHSGAAFSPTCVVIDPGETIEWRNLTPLSAIAALSKATPYEISSPALQAPYNTVAAPQSDECVSRAGDGSCAEAVAYSFWRHRFLGAGVFDYQDPSGSASAGLGTAVSYGYGMPVTPTPSGSTAAQGTVCVRGATDCATVCCVAARPELCGSGRTCVNGRCQAQ